jgi:hypothetical protein
MAVWRGARNAARMSVLLEKKSLIALMLIKKGRLQMRLHWSALIAILAIAATITFVDAQTPLRASSQLSDADYGRQLDKLQAHLDTWEADLQKVDPGRGNASYQVGKLVEGDQSVGLLQISNMRTRLRFERHHRSAYGELSIGMSLAELSNEFYALSLQGALNSMSFDAVARISAEIGPLEKSFMEDGMDRVRTLEATRCATVK